MKNEFVFDFDFSRPCADQIGLSRNSKPSPLGEGGSLNAQVLYDVLKPYARGSSFPEDRGEFQASVKAQALKQIMPLAARKTYEKTRVGRPGLEDQDLSDSYKEMAEILKGKLATLRESALSLDLETWEQDFLKGCEASESELTKDWETNWLQKCNGKKLLQCICDKYSISRDRKEIKKEIVRRIRSQQTPEWQSVDALLRAAMKQEGDV